MIAHTIQLALAPVFVLVALGNILNILSARMGRIVDRARFLQARHGETAGVEHDQIVREIRTIDRRISLIGRAIAMLVLSGLSIGTTVATLFLDELIHVDLSRVVGSLFLLAISLLMAALVLFLHETRIAAASLRIADDFLEAHRQI